ncbi:hypothetical protein [Streptomyces vilmorinianum]|uniref:hypothetical protein n=1 Tax=Streptomyces vilmorinianum TaxID=3051092 RepID=UPI0010FAE0A1|nr:hypothetical protein [Streptomyces vilmorinianum]
MLKPITAGLVSCSLLTACGGGEEQQKEEERVTAIQQCDGILSPEAAKALPTVLRTERFRNMATGGVGRAVEELTSDYANGKRWSTHSYMCRVRAESGRAALDIDFGLYDPSDLIGEGRVINMYPYEGMGREAHAGFKRAYLFLECVSPRLKGSEEVPVRIRGRVDLDKPWPPDTVATREANLTVLHSVARAIVKELGCENNAGLPEEPVLKAK